MAQQQSNNATSDSITIYGYEDYRLYLADRVASDQKRDPSWTNRSFAQKAGFSNPGYLNDVIKGRRKLSADALQKTIAALELAGGEADFFRILVAYNQEKDEEGRQRFYKKLVARRNHSSFVKLDPALSRYYQDYRYSLIRTALMACEYRGNAEALGSFVYPPVPANVVTKLIGDLRAWGLIVLDESGRYVVTERYIEPPQSLKDQVRQLHREWITQTLDPLMRLSAEKRHISSMLVATSPATAQGIAERIASFRDEIWAMIKEDQEEPTCLMQLNIQYIPKSKRAERS